MGSPKQFFLYLCSALSFLPSKIVLCPCAENSDRVKKEVKSDGLQTGPLWLDTRRIK